MDDQGEGRIDEAERQRVEAEFLARVQEEMRLVTVDDYLTHLLPVLSSMAFQRLGLTPESAAERDLAQSRLAIDAFGALAEILAPLHPEQEAHLYRSTLHQMRIAYLAAGEGKTAEGPEGETEKTGETMTPGEPESSGEPETDVETDAGSETPEEA